MGNITLIGLLRLAGYAEGTTLILLLFITVPLKRIFKSPELVSVIVPLHILAYLIYMVFAISLISDGGWKKRGMFRIFIVALIPFGTFANDPFLSRREKEWEQV